MESIPGATTGNIVVDGKEVAYATQASTVMGAVGGAQLTAPMIVAGGNGAATSLPITVYSVWGTPSGSVDTVAQASARTAFEVARLAGLGIPFGLGSGLSATATDNTCAFDGTSIDQGFEAGGVPVSTQLSLGFPCTLHDFSITGQPEADMDAAVPDRAGRYFHAHAPRNIAYNGGVVNSLLRYNDTPQQALNELLSWNRQMHALGYKTIASTMLSNGGTNSAGTSVDTLAQQFNQLLLGYADEFDWLANPAAWPHLGATGAFGNTTYFNADGGSPTHPTVAGAAFYIAAEQTAFNGVYPSVTRTIANSGGTTQFSQNPSDRVILANCTAACSIFLIDANNANFNSKGKLTVQNIGTANVTLAAVSGETIGAAQTLVVTPASSTSIIPYEANFTTAGANWAIQAGGGSGTSIPTGTTNAPLVYQSPTTIGPATQANFLAAGILTGVPKGTFATGTYGFGDVVQSGSNTYQSLVANNTYALPVPPATSNSYWVETGSLVVANPNPGNCPTVGQSSTGLNANFTTQCGNLYAADSGAANAYAVTGVTGTVAVGSEVKFLAANTNTGASTLSVNGTVYPLLKKTSAGLAATVANDIVAGQVYTVTYDGTEMQFSGSAVAAPVTIFGTGAPTLVPTSGSVVYQDATFSSNPLTVDQGRWLPSPHGWFWKNTKTGAISVVAGLGFLTTDPITGATCVADYEMNETSGTTIHDTCGSNNLTLTQAYPTLNGGNGLNFLLGNAGYVSLPAALANNSYTYQISTTIPTGTYGWENPVLMGTSTGSGSSLLLDHTNTPCFCSYAQLVAQTIETNTPFAPSGPTSLLFQLNGMTGTQQFWEGTVPVPMTSLGLNYNWTGVTAGTFYLGNQDGSVQKTFNGTIYKTSVWSAGLSPEFATWLQAYRDQQEITAGVPWSVDGPLVNAHNPVVVMVGDSIDAGVNSGSANIADGGAPGLLIQALGNSPTIINAGVGSAKMCGTGVGSIQVNVNNILPFIRSRAPQINNFTMILQGTTNDFAGGSSSATVLACTKAAIDAGHANGFKVIAETDLPRAPLSLGATNTASMNAYNAALLAANYADDTIDFGSDPQFQYPYQNTNLAADATHPFDTLYAVKAARYRNELNKQNAYSFLGSVTDAYSSTANFDLSVSLQHTMLLTGTPSYFTVSGENPGTRFSLFFQQPATGSTYTVPYPSATTGAGATATFALSGSTLTPTLTANGNGFYKTGVNTPMIVPQAVCTTNTGRVTPTITSGNIASITNTIDATGCTSVTNAAAIIFNPELIWQGSPTMPSSSDANGKITRLSCEVDSTKTNVFCTN